MWNTTEKIKYPYTVEHMYIMYYKMSEQNESGQSWRRQRKNYESAEHL